MKAIGLILLLTCLKSYITSSYYQRIVHNKYVPKFYKDASDPHDYHDITVCYSDTSLTINENEKFTYAIVRNSDNEDIISFSNRNVQQFNRYARFLPELLMDHCELPYIAWDINMSDCTSGANYCVNYKAKYYKCVDEAQNAYDDLLNFDKLLITNIGLKQSVYENFYDILHRKEGIDCSI